MRILLIILFILPFSISEQCQKVICSPLSDPEICISPLNDTSTFQLCSSNKTCSPPSEDPIDLVKCEEKKNNPLKKYSNLSCSNNNECYSNKCINNLCEGIKENEICNFTNECIYGKVCRFNNENDTDKTCQNPKKENEKCENEKECENEYGCLNNKCTKYFSLKNGESENFNLNEFFSFCESGYSDENGVCKNLTLNEKKIECDDNINTCEYYDNNGNIFKVPENCLCGYNNLGKQYCLLGSGNENYTKFIRELKKYHFNNSNCHLDERSYKGCLKDLEENKSEKINQIKYLINLKYWAKENNKLYNIPECVLKIELPEYNLNIIDKDEKKCAKYKCVNNLPNNYCAQSTFKSQSEINILLSDICKDNNKCYLEGKKPNDFFYEEENKNALCKNSLENPIRRYPGEDCNNNTDCYYPINTIYKDKLNKCENNKCTGLKNGEKCYSNEECIVGLYCDEKSKKCKEQGEKGDSCLNSFECENDLLCNNNICENILFSFEEGKPTPKNEKNREKYCKYNEIDSTGKCIKIIDQNKTKENEYRQCDRNMRCLYNTIPKTSGNIIKNCDCGYNPSGYGYCPKFHDYFEDDWKNYFSYLKKKYDNKCHSLNRYNCYLKSDYDDKINAIKNKVIDGHLFFQSESCVEKVLKGNYMKFNSILIVIFIALFI